MIKQTVGKEIAAAAKKCEVKPSAACIKKINSAENIEPLCKMFFKEDNWAMENDFPSLETLRKFQGKSDEFGLHTDFKGVVGFVKGTEQQAAFFGKSNAEIQCDPFTAGVVIIRHDSKLKIKADENVFLVVNLMDKAFVEIEAGESSKIVIHQYGTDSNFRITGNVEVKEGKFNK